MPKKKQQPRKLDELVKQCRGGDNSAWHELVDLLAPVVFSICRQSRLSRDESFDIFGQVCLEMLKTITSVRQPEKLRSLVAVITRRQVGSYYSKFRWLEFLDEETLRLFPDEAAVDPEKRMHEQEKADILLDAILSLPERDYRLIKALFLNPGEPSYEEIAATLGIPVSSIGPTRARALARLKNILKRKKQQL